MDLLRCIRTLLTKEIFKSRMGSLALAIIIASVGAIVYFIVCISLPPYNRGFTCCDASVYLSISNGPPSSIWHYSSIKVFGYPFYLSVFRWLSSGVVDFLVPALSLQLLLHVISSVLLALALIRAGLKVPVIAVGLLIAHPTLVGMSSQVLTDSLATSLISILFALGIFILRERAWFAPKCVAFGALLGLALSLRLSFQVHAVALTALLGFGLFCLAYKEKESWLSAFKRAVSFFALVACGVGPTYIHLISNCYSTHHEICISPSSEAKSWMAESFNYTLKHPRMWAIIKEDGGFRWGYTEERTLLGCDIPNEGAAVAMLQCYARNWAKLPSHIFKHIIGIFDNRHLNIHAAAITDTNVFWTVRSFSIVGYLGVFSALLIFLIGIFRASIVERFYLLMPLLYLAIQINFHTETRYIYPVVPAFFLIGISNILRNQFQRKWIYALLLIVLIVLTKSYLDQVTAWDAQSLRDFGLR